MHIPFHEPERIMMDRPEDFYQRGQRADATFDRGVIYTFEHEPFVAILVTITNDARQTAMT
jgi:hypothetical protein